MPQLGIEKSRKIYLSVRCSRCNKKLKKAYTHKGLTYGPECVLKVGGIINRCLKVKIKDAKEDDIQMGLFDE